MNSIELGSRLKRLRKSKGKTFTITYVSEMVGVAVSTYCNYEKGRRRPSYETLKVIAGVFGVSVDYLLSNEIKI